MGDELLVEFIKALETKKESFFNNCVLVPIPLYWYKENLRGFNQSNSIASQISQKTSMVLESGFLVRKKYKKAQALLDGSKRRTNLRDVFAVNSGIKKIPEKVILVDDVFTTGSTMKEAAKVLKKSGVLQVFGMTLAR